MKFPCEITLWYILPGVRSELAKELVSMGFTQKEVSDKLDLTQASVSYYVRKKRGQGIKFGVKTKEEIKRLAKDIKKGKKRLNITSKICNICRIAKKDKTLCRVHRKIEKVPRGCDTCLA